MESTRRAPWRSDSASESARCWLRSSTTASASSTAIGCAATPGSRSSTRGAATPRSSSIRRALGDDAVVTVRRRGWRLNPDVVAVAMALIASLG